jgi:hypothetical protein
MAESGVCRCRVVNGDPRKLRPNLMAVGMRKEARREATIVQGGLVDLVLNVTLGDGKAA